MTTKSTGEKKRKKISNRFLEGLESLVRKVNIDIGIKERDEFIKNVKNWQENYKNYKDYDFRANLLDYIETNKHIKTGEFLIQCGFNVEVVYLLYSFAKRTEKMSIKQRLNYIKANKRQKVYKLFFNL